MNRCSFELIVDRFNVISQYDYAYDAADRRINVSKSGSAFDHDDSIAYGYNARSELTNAVAAIDSDYRYAYDFDDIGNRVSASERGTNSVYAANNLNQYTAVDDFTPQFDDDGNQTLIKTATGVWQVQYNGENRPTLWSCIQSNNSNNTNNQTILSMSYDRMGRRVSKNNLRFVYDGYLQIANFEHSTSNLELQTFVWDPTEPVATRPLVWNSSTFQPFNFSTSYYTHDGNKNVSEVVAANGVITAHYEYAPFGAVRVMQGECASANPWRFSSEYAEDDSATVYYNYRHYEPIVGRWPARDPIEELGGVSLYAFCGNLRELVDVIGCVPKPKKNTVLIEVKLEFKEPAISFTTQNPIQDNPDRIKYLRTLPKYRKGISITSLIDDGLGITDPVLKWKTECKCVAGHMRAQKISGYVVLNINIRYVDVGGSVTHNGKSYTRTTEGVEKTKKHELFHAEYFSGVYKARIEQWKPYQEEFKDNVECDRERKKFNKEIMDLQHVIWEDESEYNHSSDRWVEWLEKNGEGVP